MKSNRFYLACTRDNVGSNVGFHRIEGRGYSTNIDEAETYTLEQAQRAWNHPREYDLPLCADRVDALTEYHVDCQYIPTDTVVQDNCNSYVAYKRRSWDGNDVYWQTANGSFSTNFNQAKIFNKPDIDSDLVFIPFQLADEAKRRTINVQKVNKRKMVQAAGLVTPAHVKRHQRSKSTGKTRWNCPVCGRLSWQYNPYDFEGCSSIDCDAYSAY